MARVRDEISFKNAKTASPFKENIVSSQAERGSSSVGRALASQAKGRGFEPRLPLMWSDGDTITPFFF